MAIDHHRAGGIGRAILGGVVLLAPPLLIAAGYLWLSRTYNLWNWQSGTPDYIALAASVATGVVGVVLLPISRIWRAVIVVAYIPLATCVVTVWSLAYVCNKFGACL